MEKITIWHNPRCSKSREALAILDENAQEKEVYKYLQEMPSEEQIKGILAMLEIQARELMRTKEDIYKELDLKNTEDETLLIKAMVQHPKLIERPIVIKGTKAIIGRPPSLIVDFLTKES